MVFMGILRKIGLVFLVLLFALFFNATIFLFNAQSVLLDKSALKQSLEKSDFYEAVGGAFAGGLSSEEGAGTDFSVDNAALESALEQLIDNGLDYVNGTTDELNLEVSPAKILGITDVNGFLMEQLERKLEETPACEDANQFGVSEEGMPECIPPDFNSDAFVGDFIVENALEIGKARESLSEVDLAEDNPGIGSFFETARAAVRMFSTAIIMLFAALLFLLALVALLVRKSLPSVLKWVGIAIAFGALAAFAISQIALKLASEAVPGIAENAEMPKELGNALALVAADLLTIVFSAISLQAIALFFAGIVLIALGFFAKRLPKGGKSSLRGA